MGKGTTSTRATDLYKRHVSPGVRKRIIYVDCVGQCQHCLDLFSVTIFRHQGKLLANETAATRLVRSSSGDYMLIHRPGLCNGEVKIYGSQTA